MMKATSPEFTKTPTLQIIVLFGGDEEKFSRQTRRRMVWEDIQATLKIALNVFG